MVRIQPSKPVGIPKKQNSAYDKLIYNHKMKKDKEIEQALQWCEENGKCGDAALSTGLFPTVRCPRTINNRLDGKVVHRQERRYCAILTELEERSLVTYIKNKNRAKV